MMRSVFLKTLYDKRGFIIGWTLGMLILAVLMASFFPAMRQEGGLDALVEGMPEALQGLVGSLTDMQQFDTYIASQLFDIRVPIIAGIMAIVLGLGLSTREEESGELRSLLALPISRTRLLIEKWLAMIVIFGVTILGLIGGVYLSMPFLADAEMAHVDLWLLGLMTWLVTSVFGTITYGIGMASGHRGLAMLVSTVIIVGSFLLTTFAMAVDWLQPYEQWSLLHYFPAADIVRSGLEMTSVLVLKVFALVSLAIAWAFFRHRDIN